MDTFHAADRAALILLRALVAISILLLAGLALALIVAGSSAAAPACKGKNLLDALRADRPAEFDALRAEAGRTPNGEGLLWEIEKDGKKSYLFGTMHMTDPRVVSLPPAAQRALDESSAVVIETTDVLDKTAMMAAILAHPELTMFTDGTTLTSLLPKEEVAAVNQELDRRGIPPASVARMKPWMLSAMLALPACEMARQAEGEPVLDVKLAEDAKRDGKSLQGLETAVSQLQAMASLPMDFHVKGLVETLKLGDRMDDVVETMIVLYTDGETGMFWPFFRTALPTDDSSDGGYAAFEETMVTARNRTMADHAAPILTAGGAFIAVGALHLPGPEGLIEILRKDGFSVSRVE